MGSHPPTLLTLLRRALTEDLECRRGDRVLVAVSGGGDSMALLHGLAVVREEFGLGLEAHGVDHGLRPEAGAELDLVEEFCAGCGVPFRRTVLAVPVGGNLQARAREARYRALRQAARARGCPVIATAHHADDRAETVLLRLLRGAGPGGLAVLPARSEDLVRPLLRARKADIRAHLTRHQVPHVDDPSNRDRRFLRTRVRDELLPLLSELEPAAVGHLNALADALAEHAPALVVDATGQSLLLGRRQQLEVVRAVRLGKTAEVRTTGGVWRVQGGAVRFFRDPAAAEGPVAAEGASPPCSSALPPHDK